MRVLWATAAVLLLLGVPAAEGQTTLGGHIGFVLPLVTHAAGKTTNISDTYFVEAVFPVRFNRPFVGASTVPVTFGLHFGLGF